MTVADTIIILTHNIHYGYGGTVLYTSVRELVREVDDHTVVLVPKQVYTALTTYLDPRRVFINSEFYVFKIPLEFKSSTIDKVGLSVDAEASPEASFFNRVKAKISKLRVKAWWERRVSRVTHRSPARGSLGSVRVFRGLPRHGLAHHGLRWATYGSGSPPVARRDISLPSGTPRSLWYIGWVHLINVSGGSPYELRDGCTTF